MINVYSPYAVAIGAATVIRQITNVALDPAVQEMLVSGSGRIDPEHASVASQIPMMRFTTTAIKTAIDAAGVSGLKIDQTNDTNQMIFQFQRRAQGGTFDTGSSHTKLTIKRGLLKPVTVNASQGDTPATIEYELVCLYDGANAPVIIETDQALVDKSPAISDVWTVGPWWVNAALVDGIQDFTMNFGINHNAPLGSGEVWSQLAYIQSRAASMTCTSLDTSPIVSAVGLLGIARSGSTRAFLRKKAQGGANVLDATAEHIRFDVAEGRITTQNYGSDHQGDATIGLLVTPTFNGTNDPIAVNTAAAVAVA